MSYIYYNGELLSQTSVNISYQDLGLLRGYGCFDFFPVIEGIPLFVEDYVDRFFDSVGFLQLPIRESKEEMIAAINSVIKKNEMKQGAIRLVATGGTSENVYALAERPLIMILPEKYPTVNEQYLSEGLRLKSMDYQRDYPKYKLNNYVTGIKFSLNKGKLYDDLLFTPDGIVTELPRSNVFLVDKDDQISTPDDRILMGVTRKCILECAKRIGMPVVERQIAIEEVKHAKMLFLTGSGSTLLPIQKVDDIQFNLSTFAMFNRLREELFVYRNEYVSSKK